MSVLSPISVTAHPFSDAYTFHSFFFIDVSCQKSKLRKTIRIGCSRILFLLSTIQFLQNYQFWKPDFDAELNICFLFLFFFKVFFYLYEQSKLEKTSTLYWIMEIKLGGFLFFSFLKNLYIIYLLYKLYRFFWYRA